MIAIPTLSHQYPERNEKIASRLCLDTVVSSR